MSKKETRFLVTTAIENTWAYDQPVLFLGEWCKSYHRKHIWQQIDHKTLPWHWDDKELLMKDKNTLEMFYEEMLSSLTIILNEHHGVDRSNRYWRIVLNPWLNNIIYTLYDRWVSIINAYDNYNISNCHCYNMSDDKMIPLHSIDFKQNIANFDNWNHYVFAKIISFLKYKHKVIDSDVHSTVEHDLYKPSFVRLMKFNILKGIEGLFSLRQSSKDPLFIQTMMDKKFERDLQQLFLSTNLAFVRRLVSYDHMLKRLKADIPLRSSLKVNLDNNNLFQSFAVNFITQQLPICYLEGYTSFIRISKKLPFPKEPKFIYTAVSYVSSETTKLCIAEAVDSGSKLYIANHGASYGTARYFFYEEHEKKISDKVLTWGWKYHSDNTYPYGNIKIINKRYVSPKKAGKLLLVSMIASGYFSHFTSCIAGSKKQWVQYTKDSQRFYTLLDYHIQELFLFRLSPCYKGDWSGQKERWLDFSDRINQSMGGDINEEYKKSRIVIVDYDGTPFLECLSMDFPVLLIQNPEFEPLRDEALPYYKNLEGVGIYHKSIESAASHINSVWNSIDEWWYNNETIKVKEEFVYHFARVPERPLEDFKKIIDMEDNL